MTASISYTLPAPPLNLPHEFTTVGIHQLWWHMGHPWWTLTVEGLDEEIMCCTGIKHLIYMMSLCILTDLYSCGCVRCICVWYEHLIYRSGFFFTDYMFKKDIVQCHFYVVSFPYIGMTSSLPVPAVPVSRNVPRSLAGKALHPVGLSR